VEEAAALQSRFFSIFFCPWLADEQQALGGRSAELVAYEPAIVLSSHHLHQIRQEREVIRSDRRGGEGR